MVSASTRQLEILQQQITTLQENFISLAQIAEASDNEIVKTLNNQAKQIATLTLVLTEMHKKMLISFPELKNVVISS